MGTDLDDQLEGRWAEYRRLRDAGEAYSAAIRIAEIENCLEHQHIRKPVRHKWEARIRQAESVQDFGSVLTGAVVVVERLQRILSAGADYVYEELMLAITMRVELDLLLDFLARRGPDDAVASKVRALDEALLEIAHSRKHRAPFLSAQAAARRNWGVPLDTRWLASSVAN